jgi:hypothetical protein
VDEGAKIEHFVTLFTSVVAIHLLGCPQDFTNCAAKAKPDLKPMTFEPKTASSLENFVLQFNSSAMALRAKDRDHFKGKASMGWRAGNIGHSAAEGGKNV